MKRAVITGFGIISSIGNNKDCLLYTSDAADDMQCVDLGGRRIIKKRVSLDGRCVIDTT